MIILYVFRSLLQPFSTFFSSFQRLPPPRRVESSATRRDAINVDKRLGAGILDVVDRLGGDVCDLALSDLKDETDSTVLDPLTVCRKSSDLFAWTFLEKSQSPL